MKYHPVNRSPSRDRDQRRPTANPQAGTRGGIMLDNPNPFYFVPFDAAGPKTFDEGRWNDCERYSGRLKIELTARTPLHIVGLQRGDGKKIRRSEFYVEDGMPCIPGSSIRGMLRSFVEALTNGWVSQVDEEYKKVDGRYDPGDPKKKGRHIGFRAFGDYPDPLKRPGRSPSPPAIPPNYRPGSGSIGYRDVASWLFGGVTTRDDGKATDAYRGHVRVEDARFAATDLEDYSLPDIEGNAFMGGGKPSASSWWYFEPHKVRQRDVGANMFAEFVGIHLRGRKFYFHQDPVNCLKWYDTHWKKLNVQLVKNPKTGAKEPKEPEYYTYPLKCLKKDGSATFFIFIHDLPKPLLALLCLCLMPGNTIRHKLGYGKPYGLGSIELEITQAMLRKENPEKWPEDRKNEKNGLVKGFSPVATGLSVWDDTHLKMVCVADLVHTPSLEWLARILGWPHQNLIFTYPPYAPEYYKQPVRKNIADAAASAGAAPPGLGPFPPGGKGGGIFAQNIFRSKKTVDLSVYQQKSSGWSTIDSRKP